MQREIDYRRGCCFGGERHITKSILRNGIFKVQTTTNLCNALVLTRLGYNSGTWTLMNAKSRKDHAHRHMSIFRSASPNLSNRVKHTLFDRCLLMLGCLIQRLSSPPRDLISYGVLNLRALTCRELLASTLIVVPSRGSIRFCPTATGATSIRMPAKKSWILRCLTWSWLFFTRVSENYWKMRINRAMKKAILLDAVRQDVEELRFNVTAITGIAFGWAIEHSQAATKYN